MITFQLYVSGEEIGRALVNDPEELACALRVLSDCQPAELGSEVAEFLVCHDKVAAFLRDMANAIDGGREVLL